MLVAMTYSVELFICVVVGLVVGHALLNSHTPVGETIDPCCASQNQQQESPMSTSNHSAMAHTPRENIVYQGNGVSAPLNDLDAQSQCNCEDARYSCKSFFLTKIKFMAHSVTLYRVDTIYFFLVLCRSDTNIKV
jgi:hypothetical protein